MITERETARAFMFRREIMEAGALEFTTVLLRQLIAQARLPYTLVAVNISQFK
jgi:hypothetical protein